MYDSSCLDTDHSDYLQIKRMIEQNQQQTTIDALHIPHINLHSLSFTKWISTNTSNILSKAR